MKPFLPSIAVAAAVASADALQWPSLTSLRGSDSYAEADLSDECASYYNQGIDDVNKMWKKKPFYSDCDNVWGLEDAADDLKDSWYPDAGNWRTVSNNQCARNGVDYQVDSIEKECLWDDSSQCTDLGNAAAEQVVMRDFCSPGTSGYGGTSHKPDYKEECRDAAVGICEGNISNVANRWCPDKNLSMGKLKSMQAECEDQVNDMVGMGGDDDDTDRSPDDCGRGGGCGSCKKAYCPDTSERKECKKEHCSLEDLAIFFPEDVEWEATMMESK